jgi:putative ABC transport system permease protein
LIVTQAVKIQTDPVLERLLRRGADFARFCLAELNAMRSENMIARLRAFASRIRGFFSSRRLDADFQRELSAHLSMLEDENLRRGLSPGEARRQARLRLGAEPPLRESQHDLRSLPWLESLAQDIRFGLRMLRKSPGFTAVAILTLALGATTAMFTIVNGIVLNSLGYPNPNQIVAIDTHWTDSGGTDNHVTGGDLQDIRNAKDCFQAFSYYSGGEFGVQLSHSAEFVGIYETDPDFFNVFQVPPVAGRTFIPADAGRAAVVSETFALRNFGSASAALGQVARIDTTAYQIVGVMPASFQFPRQAQMWAAVSPTPWNRNRSSFEFQAVARLSSKVPLAQANQRLLSIAYRLASAFPGTNGHRTFFGVPLQRELSAPVRATLFVLLGACGLVLLIACANVANLMLARSAGRTRELAVRAVLGAGKGRLIRQLLCESMILAVAAGLFGIALARWGTTALLALGAKFLPAPLLVDIRFDWRVLTFATLVTLFTSILFGIAPAYHATRVNLQDAVKQGGSHGSVGGPHARLRNLLVVSQISLALLLAVSATLLFRTILALRGAPLGYRTEGILVTYAHAPAHTLDENLRAGRFFDALFDRLRDLPHVVSVAGAMGMPSGQYGSVCYFAIQGKQSWNLVSRDTGGDYRRLPNGYFALASPGYFSTMGIPLLRGRDFTAADLYDRPFVAIISESLARRYFPHEDPLGHRIMSGFDATEKWTTIVGIVGDVRQKSPDSPIMPEVYQPMRQHPYMANELQVVIRTSGPPEALIPGVRKTIHGMDPAVAMKFTTMNAMVADSISAQRFRAALAAIFAALALLLALSGTYAVVSYMTAQRTAEFGLRSALGAQPANILRLVLGGAARLAAVGTFIGLLLSLFASRLIASMLFGVRSFDAPTYAIVIAVVLLVVVLAAAIPARRASRVDPMVALRHE